MSKTEDKIAIARAFIEHKGPYFMHLIYGLIPIEDKKEHTVSVTARMVMRYNPELILALSVPQVAGVLVHEVSHIHRDHFERFAHVEPAKQQIASMAGDLSINPDLLKAGWELPEWVLLPKKFGFREGLTAEEYYNLLLQLKNKPKVNLPKGSSAGKGDGDDTKDDPPKVCAGGCGSAAAGKPDDPASENGMLGRSPIEIDVINIKTAHAVENFVSSQGRGNVPNYLIEMSKLLLQAPKVRWQQELPHVIRRMTGEIKAGGADYSRRRPSRRSMLRGMILPGLIERTPEFALIRDTSGSMGAAQLNEATSEAVYAMRAAGVSHAWFLDADTQVAFCKRVCIDDIPHLPIHGRGGTSFDNAILQALELKPKPNVIIYFTDGDGGVTIPQPLGVNVIWCVVNSYYNKTPINWGHYIQIN